MNIEVGEYIRTINGTIFKIIDGNSDNYDIDFSYFKLEFLEDEWFESNRYNDNGYFFNKRNIVYHSKNITDLIQTGDYVNGKKVVSVGYGGAVNVEGFKFIKPNDIKTIVTKEAFCNAEYRVETN